MKKMFKKFMGLLAVPAMFLASGCSFDFDKDDENSKEETVDVDEGFEKYLQAANTTKSKTEYTVYLGSMDDDGMREYQITGNSNGYYERYLDAEGEEVYYLEVEKVQNSNIYSSSEGEQLTEAEFKEEYSISSVAEFLTFLNRAKYEEILEDEVYEFDDCERLISKNNAVHTFTKKGNVYTWKISAEYKFADYEDVEYSSIAEMVITFDEDINEVSFVSTDTEIGTTNSVKEINCNYRFLYYFSPNLVR